MELVIKPLTPVVPPADLELWINECEDTELAGELRELLPIAQSGCSWTSAVILGALATRPRLDPNVVLDSVRQRRIIPTLARPRVWVRSLPQDQLDTLGELALAECDLLSQDADDDNIDPKRLIELDSVRVLLTEAGWSRLAGLNQYIHGIERQSGLSVDDLVL